MYILGVPALDPLISVVYYYGVAGQTGQRVNVLHTPYTHAFTPYKIAAEIVL